MAVGIAAVLLIGVYVLDELGYDRFHENADRICRLTVRQQFENGERIWHQSAWFMGPRLSEEYPYILDYVRFFRFNRVVEHDDRKFRASGYSVDANVFDIFTFPLVRGDARTALAKALFDCDYRIPGKKAVWGFGSHGKRNQSGRIQGQSVFPDGNRCPEGRSPEFAHFL